MCPRGRLHNRRRPYAPPTAGRFAMDNLLPVVLSVCCGIDVHKKTVTACLLQTGVSGEAVCEVRTFRTVTDSLQELARWLVQAGCRHVALESTGVYWKPVFNVLEPAGLEVVLVNAQHVKNVPGRKTDVKDAEWPATLLRVGLLRASFVPPKEIRELRDLTRYRTQVIRQRAQECNRIQKLLEDCNIKLASVATDILGPAVGTCCTPSATGWIAPASWPIWRGVGCATSSPSWRKRCAA